jgi:predicted Zn finger-like uncharacterized protein
MRLKNCIVCPYCGMEYEIEDDLFNYKGEALQCEYCQEVFQVVDIDSRSYVIVHKII